MARLNVTREPLRTKLFSALEVQPDVRPITKAIPPPPPPSDAPPVVADVAPLHADPIIAPDPPTPTGPLVTVVPGIIAVKQRDRFRNMAGSVLLSGAGAVAAAPLYQNWFQHFKEARIDYQNAGVGVKELSEGKLDFVGADSPAADSKLLPFPAAVSAVVPIYNVPGIYDGLKLTPELLAGIYLGEIRYWNDSRIRAVNPRASVPPTPIILVHRSDASASTVTLTDYLSKVSPAWKSRYGVSASPKWPFGSLAGQGDEGVAAIVHETPYSLGYLDFAWASRNNVPFGAVKNRAGHFVHPTLESLTSAAARSDVLGSITDAPGEGSYPMAAFTYILVPRSIDNPGKRAAMLGFLRWMMTDGQSETANFQYAPLPPEVVMLERQQLPSARGR